MALSGLDIYKLLPGGIKPPHPKANCKECGFPTCLAFAMKLAAKQAELAACAYVTDEAKARLSAAAAPPIRLITLRPTATRSRWATRRCASPAREDLHPPNRLAGACARYAGRSGDHGAGEGRRRLQGGLRRHVAAPGRAGG